jgi:hypothetical protein
MALSECDFASHVKRLFDNVAAVSRSSWSVALQNGRSHSSRVSIENDVLVLTTDPLYLDVSPERVLAINASLPASTRIVCRLDGLRIQTELALSGHDANGIDGKICEAAVHDFRCSLDVLGGASFRDTAAQSMCAIDIQDPAPDWNARENGDGSWTVPLAETHAVLLVSASLAKVGAVAPGEYPQEVRCAVAEYLLRVTSQIRFVKACATEDSDTNWTAWLQAAPCVCGIDDAIAAVALAYRETARELRVLTELRIAQRFREIGSIWRAAPAPISKERR